MNMIGDKESKKRILARVDELIEEELAKQIASDIMVQEGEAMGDIREEIVHDVFDKDYDVEFTDRRLKLTKKE